MADVYLFPAESVATDVRLREPAADPVTTPPVSGGGGSWTTRPRGRHTPTFVRPAPVTVRRTVHGAVAAHSRPAVSLVVDHAGRRHLDDELVLVGVL